MKLTLQIFLVIFSFSTRLPAQSLQPNFRHISSVDGLTSGYTKCLFKDSRGFLWIGTNGGVNRFDGTNIVAYSHKIDDSGSLANNDVKMICEDSKNRIWIATSGGISVLEPGESKFTNYTEVTCDTQKILLSNGVVSVSMFRNRIWIGTLQNILSASIDTIRFELATSEMLHTTKKKIRCLPNRSFVTHAGLWMSTFSGMFFTPDGKTFYNKEHNPKNWPILNKGYIPAFYNDGDTVAYFATWNYPGIYKFRYNTDHLDSIPFRDNTKFTFMNFMSLCKVSDSEIWGSTIDHGIISINILTGAFRFYLPDRSNPQSISDRESSDMKRDEQGTVFIASGRGLDYVNPIQSQFSVYNSSRDGKEAMQLDDINVTLAEDEAGILWIGTLTKGLYSLDPSTGVIEHFSFPGDYNQVWTLFYEDGKLLMGTGAGLATFGTGTKKFKALKNEVPAEVQELTEITTNFIIKDRNDNFWIGIWGNGLLKYNFKTRRYIHFSKNDSLHPLVEHSFAVSAASLDEMGRLWLGYMTNDLSCINTNDNSITHFKLPDDKNGENYGIIEDAINDQHGNLWIGTQNGGLFKYNIEKKKFTLFDTRNGLSSNTIRTITPDKKNNLWIITLNGLNKLDLGSEKITTYSFSDGLPSNHFKNVPTFLASDGSIYAGCDIYLVRFHPDLLQANPNLPKVILSSFTKSGVNYMVKPGSPVRFHYKDRAITFEFVGINFIDPDKTRYAYKLEGFDKDWNYNDARRFATYTNLPGGDYVLRFKASNKPGMWDVPESEIKVHVDGPFWKTWWFIALCILVAGTLTYLAYYYRLQQVQKLHMVRNKIASDLHDDIGSGLSSISVFSEILRKRTGNSREDIEPFIEKIDRTARSMSEAIHDIVWTINPKNDKIEDVLERMKNFASELFTVKRIDLNFDCASKVVSYKLKMEQRKNFYLIFKEAVNNISKYAKATEVLISINIENNQVQMDIKDNGIGFDINLIRDGNGLGNMKRRAEEMGGYLNIITVPGKGTSLKLNFKTA